MTPKRLRVVLAGDRYYPQRLVPSGWCNFAVPDDPWCDVNFGRLDLAIEYAKAHRGGSEPVVVWEESQKA